MDTKRPTQPRFKKGQRVRTVLGKVETVLAVYPSQIVFYSGDWAHPTKVFAIKTARPAAK